MNIKQLLENETKKLIEKQVLDPKLKARILLSHLLKKDKMYLVINDTEEVDISIEKQFEEAVEKLGQGYPVEYITCKKEFMGLEFFVNENVLIPQPDTEILVEEAINLIKEKKISHVLDLCTGSGAIAISIANYTKDVKLVASDISNEALKVAKKNAKKLNMDDKVSFVQSNLFDNLEKDSFDMIVTNPPYIKTKVIDTLDEEVKKEPMLALDGGEDGLDFYKKIIEEVPSYLSKDGYLCMEIGYDQKEEVILLLKNNGGYTNILAKKDLSGNDRVIIAKKV